jgi:hypothetical protein
MRASLDTSFAPVDAGSTASGFSARTDRCQRRGADQARLGAWTGYLHGAQSLDPSGDLYDPGGYIAVEVPASPPLVAGR